MGQGALSKPVVQWWLSLNSSRLRKVTSELTSRAFVVNCTPPARKIASFELRRDCPPNRFQKAPFERTHTKSPADRSRSGLFPSESDLPLASIPRRLIFVTKFSVCAELTICVDSPFPFLEQPSSTQIGHLCAWQVSAWLSDILLLVRRLGIILHNALVDGALFAVLPYLLLSVHRMRVRVSRNKNRPLSRLAAPTAFRRRARFRDA